MQVIDIAHVSVDVIECGASLVLVDRHGCGRGPLPAETPPVIAYGSNEWIVPPAAWPPPRVAVRWVGRLAGWRVGPTAGGGWLGVRSRPWGIGCRGSGYFTAREIVADHEKLRVKGDFREWATVH
jgi:hypothetical protein